MFSGIISNIGLIIVISDTKLIIQSDLFNEKLVLGESFAINGICLTLVKQGDLLGTFDISEETRKTTSLKFLQKDAQVNLERSLRYGDLVGGHLVSGHIDGLAKVEKIIITGAFWEISYSIPNQFKKFIVRKGSIAIDGISLTIAKLENNIITISVIPHTLNHTNLVHTKKDSQVNFEVDTIARYVSSMVSDQTLDNNLR